MQQRVDDELDLITDLAQRFLTCASSLSQPTLTTCRRAAAAPAAARRKGGVDGVHGAGCIILRCQRAADHLSLDTEGELDDPPATQRPSGSSPPIQRRLTRTPSLAPTRAAKPPDRATTTAEITAAAAPDALTWRTWH